MCRARTRERAPTARPSPGGTRARHAVRANAPRAVQSSISSRDSQMRPQSSGTRGATCATWQ
eukprot:4032962-Pyramimonas_sp.AAC.1